jgi:multiple sugar transport system permease protein
MQKGYAQSTIRWIEEWVDRWQSESPRYVFLLPTIIFVLLLSIFPLAASVYLSLSSIKFVRGGVEITYRGVKNYEKLLSGSEERHFLGKYGEVSTLGYIVMGLFVLLLLYLLVRYCLREKLTPVPLVCTTVVVLVGVFLVPYIVNTITEDPQNLVKVIQYGIVPLIVLLWVANRLNFAGLLFRVMAIFFASEIMWLMVRTVSEGGLNEGGLPGTLGVTFIFVFTGVALQYLLGLGLALLVTQNLPGKRIFRVIFLMPMMITPVGIGFIFKMITDTILGPISPIWQDVGLSEISWSGTAFGARTAVVIGDVWQWTPFMFIFLLAALEGVQHEQVEASLVDGANSWQVFRFIVLPQILPVSTTLILIRLIEAFKIVDMPQVLTRGGPGTATEPITLHTFNLWRAIDFGTSSALAYMLLIIVTFIALSYVNFIRRRLLENL